MFLKYLIIPIISFASCVSSSPKLVSDTEVKEMNNFQPRKGAFRTVEGNKIIRTVDASQLPFTIGEEITNENQQFVLVIRNVNKSNLSVEVYTNDNGRNIRINQIVKPDNSTDGPFTNKMNYKTSKKGTYKIVIGKNLMAQGKLSGNFSVLVR